MPVKNAIKIYVPGCFYHVYNRGVEKRNIFLDNQDYQVFLFYLKSYLLPKELILKEIDKRSDLSLEYKTEKVLEIQRLENFNNRIELHCYVLMPNHYHLLLRQKEKRDLESFMRAINTRYSKYFNKKYNRVGPLFQSRYKAVLIKEENYFLHLSRYIHLNPKEILEGKKELLRYPWSSYPIYLREKNCLWVNREMILSYFKVKKGYGFSSYQGFVEGHLNLSETEKKVYKNLILD